MKELPAALMAFAAFRQFIVYKIVPSQDRPGKTDKLPINISNGKVSNAHDSSIWLDVNQAINVAQQWGEPFGVGFVFTENDPFWFVDIDDCLTPTGWAPYALQICELLSGCAVEISGSGRGLHLFGIGKPPVHACRNDSIHCEFYHSGRFAALTGDSAQGNAAIDFSAVLPSLVATYFPADTVQSEPGVWTTEPVPEWSGITDDLELIRRAIASRSAAQAFSHKASFADLWFAEPTALGLAYPDPLRPYDASSADGGLAQHLAFWTGKDCERIRRLMWMSQLVREKWDRQDYLPRTILGAVARQVDVFQAPAPVVSPQPIPAAAGAPVEHHAPQTEGIEGTRIVGPTDQAALFAGAVYIMDSHRVLIPGGHVLKPDVFRVHYGGYSFVMDHTNEKLSRDPWEAFTQSQLIKYPKVNGSCFRPDLDAAAIVARDGRSLVNTYVPVDVARKAGSPEPFLAHLAKVLPSADDQSILLSYMAACIQYKGLNQGKPGKFQWAPLLQGVEGNGKTLFTRCVAEAIRRRYVHWPRASQLAKNFNAWMFGKLFYAVEDIYVPDARREVIEELKPMITGENLEIEAKGIDQTIADICGNFMFNSNHRDAIKKTGNDRRFCVLFSAQQESADLERDGMGGDYFPALYRWLRADGYAIVSEFLHSYSIPARYNPAIDCQRAPVSSTTGEAISASQGNIEQEILEAIEQGLPGFNGGFVSSIYLEKLLERLGLLRRISPTRRREMLEGLGYKPHPALKDGRVNNVVLPDNGKPRLFVHHTALALQINSPGEVAKQYEAFNQNRPVPAHNLPFTAHRQG